MATIRFGHKSIALKPDESVLEALERHNIEIPNSCRAGVCQSCLLQATSGTLPTEAQEGLKPTWKRLGYFMSCVCKPGDDLHVHVLGEAEHIPAEVIRTERMSSAVTRMFLRPKRQFIYEPGQYITLIRKDGLARSYSLASLAHEECIELHVRRHAHGKMSTWVQDEARSGDQVTIRGPLGDCFYTPMEPERPLLLIGTGTGIGPLWGIAREALRNRHTGPITLFHGACDPSDLYFGCELLAFAREHKTFTYVPCVSQRAGSTGLRVATVDTLALEYFKSIPRTLKPRAYICGDPVIVRTLKRALFLAGLSMRDISGDEFVTASPPKTSHVSIAS